MIRSGVFIVLINKDKTTITNSWHLPMTKNTGKKISNEPLDGREYKNQVIRTRAISPVRLQKIES